MSGEDVSAILCKLDALEGKVESLTKRLDARDDADALRRARLDGLTMPLRWGLRLWQSDFGKFLIALAVAGGGSRFV